MAYADLPLPGLREHRTAEPAPPDLAERWGSTLAESRALARPATVRAVENGLETVESYDVTFSGFGGDPVAAWLQVPAGREDRALPCVVEYIGYDGGRGLPHEHLTWACAGFAHLVMDSRGQGSGHSVGSTPDPGAAGPAQRGWVTRGIESFETSYYRRLMSDAVLAVDAARSLPLVDPDRVLVRGQSQGGLLAIAAAALGEHVQAALVDVPFLCDVPRALELAVRAPYDEVVAYLAAHRDRVAATLRTLSYLDGAHLAARATSPTLFSVALRDPTCMPSTVYAAFNAWAGPKEVVEYPFNGHEGGGAHHARVQLDWVRARVGRRTPSSDAP